MNKAFLIKASFAIVIFIAAHSTAAAVTVPPGPADNTLGANGPVVIGSYGAWPPSHVATVINSSGMWTFTAAPRGAGIVWLTVNGDVSVQGAVRANEVRVTVPNGQYPDYVFAPDYKLRTLPAVELAIKADGHLPGVPSAKDIESSGLAVSTMMVKQMEKIEELTLYAIQLDKTNRDLQKRLEALEARLAPGKE